jgi:hypothetical protein
MAVLLPLLLLLLHMAAGVAHELGLELHSQTFTIIGAVLQCCHVAVWLFVSFMTAYRGAQGDLFHPPCLAATAPQPLATVAPGEGVNEAPAPIAWAASMHRAATLQQQLDRLPSTASMQAR